MSGADTDFQKIKRWLHSKPGKRGIDIPAPVYDSMLQHARGITERVWGRPPEPEHMQQLFDHGMTGPEDIHAAYGAMPHPHAPGLTVAEYPDYAHALGVYQKHRH